MLTAILTALLIVTILLVIATSSTAQTTSEVSNDVTDTGASTGKVSGVKLSSSRTTTALPTTTATRFREREQITSNAIDGSVIDERRIRVDERGNSSRESPFPNSASVSSSASIPVPRNTAQAASTAARRVASGEFEAEDELADDRLHRYVRRLVLDDDERRSSSTSADRAKSVELVERMVAEPAWRSDSSALGDVCHALLDRTLPDARRKIQGREDATRELAVLARFHNEFFSAMTDRYDRVPPWGRNWYQFSILVPRVFSQYALLLGGGDEVTKSTRRRVCENVLRVLDGPNRSLGRDRTPHQTCEMAVSWFAAVYARGTGRARIATDVRQRETAVGRMLEHANATLASIRRFSVSSMCDADFDWDLSRHYDVLANASALRCLVARVAAANSGESANDGSSALSNDDVYPDLMEDPVVRRTYEFALHPRIRKATRCCFSRGQHRFVRLFASVIAATASAAANAPKYRRFFDTLGDALVRIGDDESRFICRSMVIGSTNPSKFQSRVYDVAAKSRRLDGGDINEDGDDDEGVAVAGTAPVPGTVSVLDSQSRDVPTRVSTCRVTGIDAEKFSQNYSIAVRDDRKDGDAHKPLYDVYEILEAPGNSLTDDDAITVRVRIDNRSDEEKRYVVEYAYVDENTNETRIVRVVRSVSMEWKLKRSRSN